MNTYLFNYADYVSDLKRTCMCSKHMACLNEYESLEEGWLEANDCTAPDGRKSNECRSLEALTKFEEVFGCQDGLDIKDTIFYKEYLSLFQFDDIEMAVPDDLRDDFDYDLLYKLIAASFSSNYSVSDLQLAPEKLLPELYIHVVSGESDVTKKISELWSFQIIRLFMIYLSETMGLFLLAHEDEAEKRAVMMERDMRVLKWKKMRERLNCRLGLQQLLDNAEENK